MKPRNTFNAHLRSLDPSWIEWEVIDADVPEMPDAERRRVLRIDRDVSLYVRPSDDGIADTIAGLKMLAAAAAELAAALERTPNKASNAPGGFHAAGEGE